MLVFGLVGNLKNTGITFRKLFTMVQRSIWSVRVGVTILFLRESI